MATTGKAKGEELNKSSESKDTSITGSSGATTQGSSAVQSTSARGWERDSDLSSATEGSSTSSTSGGSGSTLSSIPGGRSSESGSRVEQMEEWGKQIKDSATQLSGQFRDRATEFVSKAQDVATDVAQRAGDLATQATDNASTTIRRYPIQSLLVGFGIGCLVGMMLPSRR